MEALEHIAQALEGIETASCITVVLLASFLMIFGVLLLLLGDKK